MKKSSNSCSNALIDNWTLEKVFGDYSLLMKKPTDEFQMILSAMVLWEEVCYFDNGCDLFWNIQLQKNNAQEIMNLFNGVKEGEEKEISSVAEKEYLDKYSDKTSIVARGALEYLYLADKHNMNYIPTGHRAEFVLENDIYRTKGGYFTRLDGIGIIDESIKKYYTELNQEMEKTQFCINTSCIYNYICKNAGTPKEMLEVAKELSKEKMVKKYRNWMQKLEGDIAINKDDYKPSKLIREYIDTLQQINHEFDENFKTKNRYDYSFGVSCVGIGISIPIHIKPRMKPHLVFPQKLFKHSI